MSGEKTDGVQAFPTGNPTHGGNCGMTLRDYFAGQALAGLLSSEAHPRSIGSWTNHDGRAQHAYRAADAMLAARET